MCWRVSGGKGERGDVVCMHEGVQRCMAARTGVQMGSRLRCKDAHSAAKMGFTEARMGAGMGCGCAHNNGVGA